MPIGKTEVLDVLGDARLRNIRFSVGPILVDHYGYEKVYDFIASGAIRVSGWKESYSSYIPKKNLLKTADRNPPLTTQIKTNILHECTHVIADYTHVKVTRLTDEVAAYLAQIAYHLLLEPTYEAPSLRLPLNNMVRHGTDLVKKYGIGTPSGSGAVIAQGDIDDLARLINQVPDYADVKPDEMLDADGVDMSGDVLDDFLRRQKARPQRPEKTADQEEVERLIREGTKVRIVAYENYVTDDTELLKLFALYAVPDKRKAVLDKLLHIFTTITQRSASEYKARLSSVKKGDAVSEQFVAKIEPDVRQALLRALAIAR